MILLKHFLSGEDRFLQSSSCYSSFQFWWGFPPEPSIWCDTRLMTPDLSSDWSSLIDLNVTQSDLPRQSPALFFVATSPWREWTDSKLGVWVTHEPSEKKPSGNYLWFNQLNEVILISADRINSGFRVPIINVRKIRACPSTWNLYTLRRKKSRFHCCNIYLYINIGMSVCASFTKFWQWQSKPR